MSETAERLKIELVRLSPEERADLAQFLIRSLDEGEDPDAEAAWESELAHRFEEIRMEAAGEPADEVIRQLREKYQ